MQKSKEALNRGGNDPSHRKGWLFMISILAYPRTGGITDLKHQRESATSSVDLQKQMEACVTMDQFLHEIRPPVRWIASKSSSGRRKKAIRLSPGVKINISLPCQPCRQQGSPVAEISNFWL